MKTKKLLMFLTSLLILITLAACIQSLKTKSDSNNFDTEKELVEVVIQVFDKDGLKIVDKSVSVEEGSNAFDALTKATAVDASIHPTFGAFVKGFNGKPVSPGYYWALTINGKYADQGISFYKITPGMQILWKEEKIEEFPLK